MIVTLLLTGRATPYIHNGVVNVGDESSYVGTKNQSKSHLMAMNVPLFFRRFHSMESLNVV